MRGPRLNDSPTAPSKPRRAASPWEDSSSWHRGERQTHQAAPSAAPQAAARQGPRVSAHWSAPWGSACPCPAAPSVRLTHSRRAGAALSPCSCAPPRAAPPPQGPGTPGAPHWGRPCSTRPSRCQGQPPQQRRGPQTASRAGRPQPEPAPGPRPRAVARDPPALTSALPHEGGSLWGTGDRCPLKGIKQGHTVWKEVLVRTPAGLAAGSSRHE